MANTNAPNSALPSAPPPEPPPPATPPASSGTPNPPPTPPETEHKKIEPPGSGMGAFFALLVSLALLMALLFGHVAFWGTIVGWVILFAAGFTIIPTAHFAVVTRFDQRTGRILGEGLRWTLPFIEKAQLFSAQLDADDIKVSFQSRDEVEVFIEGSFQWKPDKDVVYEKKEKRWWGGTIRTLWSRFAEMSEDIVLQGIGDAVKSALGIVAGQHDASQFITDREAIEDLVNCALRLERPPHLFTDVLEVSGARAQALETMKRDNEIPPTQRLDFYKEFREEVRALLRKTETTGELSEIETRYGIRIETFALSKVDFDAETKRAMARQKQAVRENLAGDTRARWITERCRQLVAAGLDPVRAHNQANVERDLADQQQYTVDSIGGGTSSIHLLLNPPQSQPTPPPPSKAQQKMGED